MSNDLPNPVGDAAPVPPLRKGDYVLATKYHDGDPRDQWAVGFYDGPYYELHRVVDAEGNQFRPSGFRRAERIDREQGDWLLKNTEIFAYANVNLWDLIKERAMFNATHTPDYSPVPPQNPRTVRATCVPAGVGEALPWGEDDGAGPRVDDARAATIMEGCTYYKPANWRDVRDLLADRAAMVKELARHDKVSRAYFNLMAIIFRDGGHRREAIGDDVAAGDVAASVVRGERDELARLREALKFYADPISYREVIDGHEVSPRVLFDDGDIARAALAPAPLPDRPGCDEAGRK